MGRCSECNRDLKDPTATIGPVCSGQGHRKRRYRVTSLAPRTDGTRRYLVKGARQKITVVIYGSGENRTADCECETARRDMLCEHIEAAGKLDKEKGN